MIFKLFICLLFFINQASASAAENQSNHSSLILWIAILVIAALFSLIVNKYRQSAVLGQLVVGALIGILAHFHIAFFTEIISSKEISLSAELGSIFLLFEIGLESDIKEIRTAGPHAISVAVIGVLVPFGLGYFIVTPYILGSTSHNLALFVGSMLAVTSTSISVSVFKELGILRLKACQIVLTASVIDDIIGLILLSVVTAVISSGSINNTLLILTLLKVILFFAISYMLGIRILPKVLIPRLIHIGKGEHLITLFIVALCLFMSWFAAVIGLAHVIGAFVAGLMLNHKTFTNHNLLPVAPDDKHEGNQILMDLILPLGKIFTPIFFIYAGMQVDLVNAFNIKTILIATGVSFFAIIGKLSCCITLPKRINRLIVGFGMVPRGEIGIIFAITGLHIGVIDNDLFTALLLVVVITSIVTPIALNKVIRRAQKVAV